VDAARKRRNGAGAVVRALAEMCDSGEGEPASRGERARGRRVLLGTTKLADDLGKKMIILIVIMIILLVIVEILGAILRV
jgi:hypothetical protein